MNQFSKVLVVFALSVTSVLADFDDIRFTTYNFDTSAEISADFVCHANLLDTAITGCTQLQAATDTEFTTEDWRQVCMEKLNFWNRDPGNAQANAVVRTPNGGQTSFGCQIVSCDGSDPANYNVEGTANGRETAVVMPNYYCGRPSAGMAVTSTSTDISADISEKTTGSLALLERGVVSFFSTPDRNAATPPTLCALRLDGSAVCWGGQDLSSLSLTNVNKFAASHSAVVALNADGTVEAAGVSAIGGDISNGGSTATNGAASGNTRDVVCTVNGQCIGILNDGTAYTWGAVDAAVTGLTNIQTIYPTWRAYLACDTSGICDARGNGVYGGDDSAANVQAILAKPIVQVASQWFGFGVIANDGTATCWGHGTFADCTAIDSQLTGVVDVKSSERGFVFLKNDNTALAGGNHQVTTPIANAASIWAGKVNEAFAVIKTDGSVEAFGNQAGNTINDGQTYTKCVSSTNAMICMNTAGGVTRLFGSAAYNIPAELASGVVDIIGAKTGIAAIKSDNSVYVIGDMTPSAENVRYFTAGDIVPSSVTPSYFTFAVARGAAAPETSFPTLSPVPAPTSSPSATPSASPSKAPTGTPTGSPSAMPTESPSPKPTRSPLVPGTTFSPSTAPTTSPSASPSTSPTKNPSQSPTTPEPTRSPISGPTQFPTAGPTPSPSLTCGCPNNPPSI